MKIKLLDLSYIANSGTYYGIAFTAIGTAKLNTAGTGFKGVTLVADVEDDLAQSLVDAEKVEKISDAELKAIKAKANPKKDTK
tara:strand:- start:317 stop:565 length:249 start_codon:yes stop_codon:yes gene_type:complete